MTTDILKTFLFALTIVLCGIARVTAKDLSEIINDGRDVGAYDDMQGYEDVLSPQTMDELEDLKTSLGVLSRLSNSDPMFSRMEPPENGDRQVNSWKDWDSNEGLPQETPYNSNIEIFNSGSVQMQYPSDSSGPPEHYNPTEGDNYGPSEASRLYGDLPKYGYAGKRGLMASDTTNELTGPEDEDNSSDDYSPDKRAFACVGRRCGRSKRGARSFEGEQNNADTLFKTVDVLRSLKAQQHGGYTNTQEKRNPFCPGRSCGRGKRMSAGFGGHQKFDDAMEDLMSLRKVNIEKTRPSGTLGAQLSKNLPVSKRNNKEYYIAFGCDNTGYCAGKNSKDPMKGHSKRLMENQIIKVIFVLDKSSKEWRARMYECKYTTWEKKEVECRKPVYSTMWNSCQTRNEEIPYGQYILSWKRGPGNRCSGTLLDGAHTTKAAVDDVPCNGDTILPPNRTPAFRMTLLCKRGICTGKCGQKRTRFIETRRTNIKCGYRNCSK